MKKLFAGALLASSLTFSVQAAPVFIMPTCTYGYTNYCTTTNHTRDVINCNIQATGHTKKGSFVSGFQYTTLQPYQMSWLYVYGNGFDDPVTFLNAHAFCNTVN